MEVMAVAVAAYNASEEEAAEVAHNLLAVAERKLAAVAVADLPAVDSPDNRATATASREVAAGDTEGACPEGHAICSNHNPFPTTSPRLVESKPIDNKRRTNFLPLPTAA